MATTSGQDQRAAGVPVTRDDTTAIGAVLRAPLRADTWRRTLYILLALPAGIACLPLVPFGGDRAAAIPTGLARWLLAPAMDPMRRPGRARVAGYALACTPVNLVGFVLTGYLWLIVVANLAYPLRPGVLGGDLDGAWGGQSLAGAWAVHGAGALGFLLLAPWFVRALSSLQGRLLRAMLGAR